MQTLGEPEDVSVTLSPALCGAYGILQAYIVFFGVIGMKAFAIC